VLVALVVVPIMLRVAYPSPANLRRDGVENVQSYDGSSPVYSVHVSR
jgi:hypothetical protein